METERGKNILITGASSGIGEACARYLSACGYHLFLVARREERLREIIKELPGPAKAVAYDLKDLDHIETIFLHCLEQVGRLDGLVHAAGTSAVFPVKACDFEEMEYVMRINLYSFVELGKYFSRKKYSNDKSSVVAVSSVAGQLCEKGRIAYSMSKAALNAAVSTMAKEFITREIRVNAVLPAAVKTPLMSDDLETEEQKRDWMRMQPLGIIQPEDIACLIEFLLSQKARYITNALIPVSAGYTGEK